MPAALIAPFVLEFLGVTAGTFLATAITFGIRLVTTFAIASLFYKPPKEPKDPGTQVQLGPNTDNKLPIAYGTRYCKPIISDALISNDQQYMYYVLALSEKTSGDVSIGEVWYDGKRLIFDPDHPENVTAWWSPPKRHSRNAGRINNKPAGNIKMWFYKDGSFVTGTTHLCTTFTEVGDNVWDISNDVPGATTVDAVTLLQDAAFPDATKWTTATMMKNTVFAVIQLHYNSKAGIYGLGSMDIEIINPLNNPGDVILDYFTNNSYGCGIPIENVNTASLATLNYYSQQPLSIVDTMGNTVTNTSTYQINGIIDTNSDCLTNLNYMTDACDSWIQWDERLGQWGVIMNISLEQAGGSTSTMRVVTSDQIIGGVNLVPTDLKTSINKISLAFPNKDIINQVDYRYYFLKQDRPELVSPNEPDNNADINFPLVTDSIQATYLGYRKLFMSREDIVINFAMDYSGIGINAGDVIALKHEWYGWTPGQYNNGYYPGKPFRVTQIKEAKDANGFLSVQLTCTAYNDSIYTTMNPHYYTPDTFGMPIDFNNVLTPIAPYASEGFLYETVPPGGNVTGMEFWISTSTFATDYQLLQTVIPGASTFFNSGTLVTYDLTTLPTYTGYAIARAVGGNSQGGTTVSSFSPPYAFTWLNNALAGNATSANTATDAINVNTNHTVSSTDFYLNMVNSASAGGYVGVEYNTGVIYSTNNSTLSAPNASHQTLNISKTANLTPLHSAPASYSQGTIALADNAVGGWDPVPTHANTGTPYVAFYNGSNWVKLG
jgi:hypothetical protein